MWFCQKSINKRWRMGRWIVMMKVPVTSGPKLQPISSYHNPQVAENFNAVLFHFCLAWRSKLMVENTLTIQKQSTQSWLTKTILCLLWTQRCRQLPLKRLGFCFRITAINLFLIFYYHLFEKTWYIISYMKHGISSLLVIGAENICCHTFMSKTLYQKSLTH